MAKKASSRVGALRGPAKVAKKSARKVRPAGPGARKARAERLQAVAEDAGADPTKARTIASRVVAAVRKGIAKKSTGTVQLLSDGASLGKVKEWIPSGFPDLDRILGGGWAIGRASEVAGDEGCGKSALAHVAIRECQRLGGVAALLDFENALDEEKCKNVGIDPTTLIYASPANLEEGWEIVWDLLEPFRYSKNPDAPLMLVWDSVAAAIPKAELEADMSDALVGVHARGMNRGCRKMYRELALSRAHVMWINQFRAKMGGKSWGGPQKDTTGGGGPRYAASQRLSCVRVARLPQKREAGVPPSGYLIKTETDKCRLAPPHRKTEWVLDFVHGPSHPLTVRHLLTEAGVLRARGAGKSVGPWVEEPFRRDDWLTLWKRSSFRKGAVQALQAVIAGGGAGEYKRANKVGGDEEEDTEE